MLFSVLPLQDTSSGEVLTPRQRRLSVYSKPCWLVYLFWEEYIESRCLHNFMTRKIISLALVWFYGILTIVGYLIPNPLYTYILNIYGLVWFYGILTIVGYLIPNPLYTYILNIYGLVWFYGILTIVGYLIPNPLYTYILNIYDLVWFGFMAYWPLLVI